MEDIFTEPFSFSKASLLRAIAQTNLLGQLMATIIYPSLPPIYLTGNAITLFVSKDIWGPSKINPDKPVHL